MAHVRAQAAMIGQAHVVQYEQMLRTHAAMTAPRSPPRLVDSDQSHPASIAHTQLESQLQSLRQPQPRLQPPAARQPQGSHQLQQMAQQAGSKPWPPPPPPRRNPWPPPPPARPQPTHTPSMATGFSALSTTPDWPSLFGQGAPRLPAQTGTRAAERRSSSDSAVLDAERVDHAALALRDWCERLQRERGVSRSRGRRAELNDLCEYKEQLLRVYVALEHQVAAISVRVLPRKSRGPLPFPFLALACCKRLSLNQTRALVLRSKVWRSWRTGRAGLAKPRK
jgi:hypothetical protein